MSKYLARVEKTNDYFNLRPIMEKIEDGLIEVDGEKFGQYGTITISAIYGQYSESPLIQDQRYCIFNISDMELNGLERTYSGFKIKASDYLQKSKTVDSDVIREVIAIPEYLSSNNVATWQQEYFSDIMPPITKTVYLEDNESVFGPFSWERTVDDRYKFIPNSTNQDPFLIDRYLKSDFVEPIYAFDAAKRPIDLYYGRERHILLIDTLPAVYDRIDCIDQKALKDLVGRLIAQSAESKREKRELKNAIASLPDIELSENRKATILRLVQNGELADQTLSLIPAVMLDDENSLSEIAKIVLNNTDYIEKLYPFVRTQEKYQAIIEKLEDERKSKETELETLNVKITEARNILGASNTVSSVEIEELEEEKKALLAELEVYKQRSDLVKECSELEQKREEIENQYNAFLRMKDNVSSDISQKMKSAYTEFAFDGALASLMLQEAAKFERAQTNQRIVETIATRKNTSFRDIQDPNLLADIIYYELTKNAKRNISRNDVVNLLICISQGFLTVFAGEPGTGKTSLVSLLANIMGLSSNSCVRYSEVAVEKGWTSRRDLIGYYNPLTKSFDIAHKGLFSAFEILDAEAKAGVEDFPYFILLDEANLSPMEHYWADFMSVCDFDKKNRQISLSEDYIFTIPSTLRFLATINLDHTTEILSPRLIDRAWIVMLQPVDIDIDEFELPQMEESYSLVLFDVFKALMDPTKWPSTNLDTAIANKFDRIRVCFKEIGVNLSPRVIWMIKRYCLASKRLFDTSENSYIALDYAVAQKVLPMIKGYGEVYQEFINRLLGICDQNSMPKCYDILQSIKRKGAVNMQYYEFFSR